MRFTSVLVSLAVAIALQMTLPRYAIGTRWVFDLVLVAVVYAALRWGPTMGMIAGTMGGLAQDALSSGVLGVDGLANTVIGFSAGALGARFVVTRPLARTLVVAAATILQRLTLAGLHAVIDQRWSGIPWRAILGETVVNALCAFVAFQTADVLPRSMQHRRSRSRTPFARRVW